MAVRPMIDTDIGRETPLPAERGSDKHLKAALEINSTALHDDRPIVTAQELVDVPATAEMRED